MKSEITEEIRQIMGKRRYEEKVPIRKIAKEFGVSKLTVYDNTNRDSFRVASIKNTEVLWGGGIIGTQDESKYAFVVGRNVQYIERGKAKEDWEVGELLVVLRTEKRRDQYALLENSNLAPKHPFLLAPCFYSRYPVKSSIYDSQGDLIDIVSSLEEADRILSLRAEEIAKGGFSSVHPDIPIRRIVNAPPLGNSICINFVLKKYLILNKELNQSQLSILS